MARNASYTLPDSDNLTVVISQSAPEEMPDAVYDPKTLKLVHTHHAGQIHIKNVRKDGRLIDFTEDDSIVLKLKAIEKVHRFTGYRNGSFDIGTTPNDSDAFEVVKDVLQLLKDEGLITQPDLETFYAGLKLTEHPDVHPPEGHPRRGQTL